MKIDNMYMYVNQKDHRVRAYYKDSNGKLHTKSYPRILMEKKLGRPLKPYEDVHLVGKSRLEGILMLNDS